MNVSAGTHLICDFWQCDAKILDNKNKLIDLLKKAITASNATLLGVQAHKFEPQGVTAVALLSESHIAIHTWPEHGYAAVDIYTCGKNMQPEKAAEVFKKQLQAQREQIQKINRGKHELMTRESIKKNKNFWFAETSEILPGYQQGIRMDIFVKKILHASYSKYQHLQVFDTPLFGKMLLLDNILQTTESDEYIYHEMIALLPALMRKKPQHALILGGGDGGALREVVRVKSIQEALIVEIDEHVVTVSKKYLPSLSNGAFDNKKTKLVIGDGMAFTRKYKKYFDVIVLDLTDPSEDNPAVELFKPAFFEDVKMAMTSDGIFSVQSGSITFQPQWVKALYNNLKSVFAYVEVHLAHIPSYQDGYYSFIMASQKPFPKALKDIKERFLNVEGKTRFLTPEMCFASKVLPKFQEDYLQSK